MSDVFTALQATLGGYYVNNFNLFGRTWQVNVQGEAKDRADIDALWQIYVRSARNEMVPLRSIATAKIVQGPQVISRYNNYRSITINGASAGGVSSGTAIAAMQEISNKTLPSGFSYEWTGTAFQVIGAPWLDPASSLMSCSGFSSVCKIPRGVFIACALFIPGLLIFFTVLSFNMVGDGLRDALDPYMTER